MSKVPKVTTEDADNVENFAKHFDVPLTPGLETAISAFRKEL